VPIPGSSASQASAPESVAATCVERAVHDVLVVDRTDVRGIWATDLESGRDVVIGPRPGVTWHVDPAQPDQLVDSSGRVAARSGDIFYTACFEASTVTYRIGPQDLPDPDRAPG
jgi:hypothetical protein